MVTHVFSTFPIPEAFLAFAETFIQDLVTAGTFSSLHPEDVKLARFQWVNPPRIRGELEKLLPFFPSAQPKLEFTR